MRASDTASSTSRVQGLAGEIGGGGGGGGLAHEDPQGEVLLARVLDRVHLPQADLGRERLVLHHEGVGLGGAPVARLLEQVGEEVQQRPRQTWVPPTVMPSMRIVGSPTPTGTDWPSLPQVPTPSSSLRSWPTRLTRVSASGPLPIRVAPLTGARHAAVLDQVGLARREDELAAGDVHLAAAEVHRVEARGRPSG